MLGLRSLWMRRVTYLLWAPRSLDSFGWERCDYYSVLQLARDAGFVPLGWGLISDMWYCGG